MIIDRSVREFIDKHLPTYSRCIIREYIDECLGIDMVYENQASEISTISVNPHAVTLQDMTGKNRVTYRGLIKIPEVVTPSWYIVGWSENCVEIETRIADSVSTLVCGIDICAELNGTFGSRMEIATPDRLILLPVPEWGFTYVDMTEPRLIFSRIGHKMVDDYAEEVAWL